mgnify:CR=1 FL=1
MMKSLFLIRSDDKQINLQVISTLVDELSKKHSNLAFFCPAVTSNDTLEFLRRFIIKFKLNQDIAQTHSFAMQEGLNAYNDNQNAFFSKIISDFERLKGEFDFVFVVGLVNFGVFGSLEINARLAKELNAPIFAITDKNERAMTENYLRQKLNGREFIIIDKHFDFTHNRSGVFKELENYDFTTPNRFRYELVRRAKASKKTLVLPESDDERILRAASILLDDELVNLTLLGDEKEVQTRAKKLGIDLKNASILNPANSPLNAEFASVLYNARKEKGLSKEQAQRLVKDRTYFGTLLVHTNKADAMVSGASTTTAETIRPALQLIKTREGVKIVSGAFFMSLKDRVLLFADCAVTPNPTPEQIAQIAYTSANTAKAFGISPKVAILSYSTGESGSGTSVEASKEAVKIAKERYPDLLVDGPLQFDAAIDAQTAQSKMPNSKVAGQANVFIFPDLNAANIAYKAVQRTANAFAIGPVLQGLKKPVNDLSRGCLVDDIVLTAILSAVQAQENEKDKK